MPATLIKFGPPSSIGPSPLLPAPPFSLSAIPTSGGIDLAWLASDGPGPITAYNVYSSSDGVTWGVPIAVLGGSSLAYTDAAAIAGSITFYRVTAVNDAGEGPPAQASAIRPVNRPSAPVGLAASGSLSGVVLTWQANTDSIAGYNVYRSTNVRTWTRLNGSTLLSATTYTDSTGTAGFVYWYAVTAVDGSGNESDKTLVLGERTAPDTLPPGVVPFVGATHNTSGVTLTWTAPNDRDLAGYFVYRSLDGSTWTKLTPSAILPTTYTDLTGVPGTRYLYGVTAIDTSGNEQTTKATVQAARDVTGPPPSAPQTAPANLAVTTQSDTSLSLSWSVVTGATSYNVYRATAATGPYVSAGKTAATTFTDPLGNDLIEFWYRVAGANAVGEGPFASLNTTPVAPNNLPPAQPTGLAVSYPAANQVRLDWTANAEPDLFEYFLFRSSNSNGPFSDPPYAVIVLPNHAYLDTNAPGGATWYYALSAVDTEGNRSPAARITANPISPTSTSPPAPIGLTATDLGNSGVRLDWTAEPGVTFNVYRAAPSNAAFSLIGTAGSGATSYTDAAPPVNQVLGYKLAAVANGQVSHDSNIVTLQHAGTTPSTATPILIWPAAGVTLQAPATVHIQAPAAPGGQQDIDWTYVWTFSDQSAAEWTTLTGFNAAHLYDQPGTYTITLTAYDANGSSSSGSITVTIAPDQRKNVYLDAVNGSDSNDGSTGAKAKRTIRGALQSFVGSFVRLYLKRGDTYDLAQTIDFSGKRGAMLDAWGAGPNPIIRQTALVSIMGFSAGSADCLIQNVDLTSSFTVALYGDGRSVAPPLCSVRGTGITWRNCTLYELGDLWTFATLGGKCYLIQDCTVPAPTGTPPPAWPSTIHGGYFYLQFPQYVVLLGNNMPAGSLRENVFRCNGGPAVVSQPSVITVPKYALVYGNTLGQNVASAKNVTDIRDGDHIYLANNTLTGGPQVKIGRDWDTAKSLLKDNGQGPYWPNALPGGGPPTQCVLDGNKITGGSYIGVQNGLTYTVFRNNVIDSSLKGFPGFVIDSHQASIGGGQLNYDVRILHNTIFSTAPTTRIVWLGNGDPPTVGYTIENNREVTGPAFKVNGGAGGGAGLVFTSGPNLSGCAFGGNVYGIPTGWVAGATGAIQFIFDPSLNNAQHYAQQYHTLANWNALVGTTDYQFGTSLDARYLPKVRDVAVNRAAGAPLDFYLQPRGGTCLPGAVEK